MGNAEAIPREAGETVEAIRRRSGSLYREPASRNVVNTPHEELFHQALIRARLSFETQAHPSGDRYEADIVLNQKPIVIEVTNSPGQKRDADRYARKTAAFEAAGYRVYWFSNHQARTAADRCVRRVIEENDLAAEEEPVALVRPNRAGHVGELNPNWGGGQQSVACEKCGTVFEAGKRNGGKTARFCGSKCYGEWLHEHPEEVKSRRLAVDWDEIARLYVSGMACSQLAEQFGCSTAAVKVHMRKRGVLRPPGGLRVPRARS